MSRALRDSRGLRLRSTRRQAGSAKVTIETPGVIGTRPTRCRSNRKIASNVLLSGAGGGGANVTVDMSGLERKLDTLIREVKRSGGDGEASIRIGEREFAKLVGDAQSNTTTSTDRLS